MTTFLFFFEENHFLAEQAEKFVALEESISDTDSPLEIIPMVQSNCAQYLDFVKQYFEAFEQYEPDDDDDLDSDDIMERLDETLKGLDQLMDTKMEQINTGAKKVMVHSVVWVLVTIALYYFFPGKWFIYIPAVLAVLSTGSLIFIVITRKKLMNKLKTGSSSDTEVFFSEKSAWKQT